MTASTMSGEEYRKEWADWLTSAFNGLRDRSGKTTFKTSLVSLTFAPREWESDRIGPTGPTVSRVRRAGLRFEKVLTASLARPSYFGVLERGGWNGRMHLHFLISSPEDAAIREAMRLHEIKDGFVSVRTRETTPAEYVSKYLSKSDGDWWVAGGSAFDDRTGAVHGGGVLADRGADVPGCRRFELRADSVASAEGI